MVAISPALLLAVAALWTDSSAASPVLQNRQVAGVATRSPPWYPSPKGGTTKSWAVAYEKAHELVSKMTLLEKVNITTGIGWQMGPCVGNTGPVPRLGFPSLCLQDGPLGIRFADKITAWPAGITVGGTWDRELLYARGVALGAEARGKGVNIQLGPAMGPLGRLPAGGRNWEGFGSDPYLQGIGAGETIKGIQSQGVIATAKHFILNEQEHFRTGANPLSANLDDRTLHEVYLWPFADSVRAGVGAIMCSYQQVNNSAACQNSKLMNGILKDELGFQGFVMSDWLAQYSGVASVLAGMDMTMPGDGIAWDDRISLLGPNLTIAALNSSIPLDRIDDMVSRIVATWYQFGQDAAGFPKPNFSSWTKNTTGLLYEGSKQPPYATVNEHIDVRADHATLARKIAADSIALLKNEDGILPLSDEPRKIGVYGSDAGPGQGPNACPDRGCNQGTLASGWGSGAVDFEYLINPLESIKAQATAEGSAVSYTLENNKTAEIKASAAHQDICLVFINADAGEGYLKWEDILEGDRPNLDAQLGGDALVLAVADECENTVVVVHSVGPIMLEKFADHDNVKAIVWANLPGQESGNSLVDVLWGAVNPSGKLPYTIAKKPEDYGPTSAVMFTANGIPPQQDYTEGLYIDYKYFDKNDITPRYEFGYGLSYTTFEYSDIAVTCTGDTSRLPDPRPDNEAHPPIFNSTLPALKDVLYPAGFEKTNRMIYPYLTTANITRGPYPYPEGYKTAQPHSAAGGGEGGNPDLWEEVFTVTVTVTNTGPVAGAEVAQLYVSPGEVTEIDLPVRQLRGFDKVYLEPGESQQVSFALNRRDVSYWNVFEQNWVLPQEALEVAVGGSSRNLELSTLLK